MIPGIFPSIVIDLARGVVHVISDAIKQRLGIEGVGIDTFDCGALNEAKVERGYAQYIDMGTCRDCGRGDCFGECEIFTREEVS